MKVFDEVLQKEENVHEEVTPEKGVNLELKDPESFKKIFEQKEEGK